MKKVWFLQKRRKISSAEVSGTPLVAGLRSRSRLWNQSGRSGTRPSQKRLLHPAILHSASSTAYGIEYYIELCQCCAPAAPDRSDLYSPQPPQPEFADGITDYVLDTSSCNANAYVPAIPVPPACLPLLFETLSIGLISHPLHRPFRRICVLYHLISVICVEDEED
jgi:hypothetical protein